MISALPNVFDSKSLRSLLWLVGEFSLESGNILAAIQAINSGLGELPMLAAEEKYEQSIKSKENEEISQQQQHHHHSHNHQQAKSKVSTKILADGTYASEINDETSETSGRQLPNIKSTKKYTSWFLF